MNTKQKQLPERRGKVSHGTSSTSFISSKRIELVSILGGGGGDHTI